jgi:tetrahydromethanopterin S-methyltransferase subunit A
VCWPADALSLVQEAGLITEGAACPAEPVEPRPGWPPLPGDYTVLRYSAPVAVCTLGDAGLAAKVAAAAGPHVAIVGTLTTENLGIERLVANTISNPHLRFVLVCGPEVEQRVRHHPGGSLLALAANGTDQKARIIAAPGWRSRLRNLTPAQITHFRAHVEVVDLAGTRIPARSWPPPAPAPPVTPARRQRRPAAWPCPSSVPPRPTARSPTRPATWSSTPTPAGGCW